MFKKRKKLIEDLIFRIKNLEEADSARTISSQFIMRRLEGEVDKIVEILVAANILEGQEPEHPVRTRFNGKEYKVKGNE